MTTSDSSKIRVLYPASEFDHVLPQDEISNLKIKYSVGITFTHFQTSPDMVLTISGDFEKCAKAMAAVHENLLLDRAFKSAIGKSLRLCLSKFIVDKIGETKLCELESF